MKSLLDFIPEPASDATRYGFGLTDQKPHWSAVAIRIALVIGTLLLVYWSPR